MNLTLNIWQHKKVAFFSDDNYLKIAIWISFFLLYKKSTIPTLPTYQIFLPDHVFELLPILYLNAAK